MNDPILTESKDGVFCIEICRPDKKNALTSAMYTALADALDAAERDAAVRVIVIHGQPGIFTAGNDLGDFLANPPLQENPPPPVFRFLDTFSSLKKPFIAAVSGVAVGVGTTLLLHCDLVYAGTSARFQLPFVSLGLCPEAASSLLLPALAGHARAAEMLLLCEPFDATKAREVGLVNAVLPDEQVVEHALAQARKLAALPAASVRLTKQMLKSAQQALIAQTMQSEVRHFKERLVSPEAKEAFAAFFDKRKPDFGQFNQ
ncbi:Enoyl-CoA hydratase/isomerase [Sterolibacterium denitrificans]|uniref:Enoyl-CoA hydratase/isomerase n=1 Tax=Sterolibacterium denitrificans TaxID=157592 RepID=A0A7Z7HRM2_9PROT|nr:enoyl-CoA hydratase [Sterolibacterium denitrificans]SMB27790.1 Enoyl-CoA hydratase/isomerase [Sterolibacterium denitrificans]